MAGNAQLQRFVLLTMLVALLAAGLLIWLGLRKIWRIRAQVLELNLEHDATFAHIDARLAAQKALVAAEQSTGEERRAHLLRALDEFREAYRCRRVGDDYTAEFLLAQIKMIEGDLAALGNLEPSPEV